MCYICANKFHKFISEKYVKVIKLSVIDAKS